MQLIKHFFFLNTMFIQIIMYLISKIFYLRNIHIVFLILVIR